MVARWRDVQPHGVLYGVRHYLVATATGKTEPYLWSLPNIEAVCDGAPLAPPPLTFDLTAFAARSFGVYQEERLCHDNLSETQSCGSDIGG